MQLRLQLAITVQNLYEPVIMINIHLAIVKRWGPPYIDVLTDYLIITLNKDVFTNILIVHFSGKSKLENHKFKTRGENYVPHQPALVFFRTTSYKSRWVDAPPEQPSPVGVLYYYIYKIQSGLICW
jgi:hypothetical protein